jgi:preprotein translocase subunit YajC
MAIVLATLQGLLLAATSKKTSSSSDLSGFLVIAVIVALFYFLLIRPQQQRTKKQRQATAQIEVGDEVLTIGGIVGTVLDIDDDRVTLLTGVEPTGPDGPGGHPHRLVVVRQAIARKIEPTAPAALDEAELDHGDDAGGATGGSAVAEHPGYGNPNAPRKSKRYEGGEPTGPDADVEEPEEGSGE